MVAAIAAAIIALVAGVLALLAWAVPCKLAALTLALAAALGLGKITKNQNI